MSRNTGNNGTDYKKWALLGAAATAVTAAAGVAFYLLTKEDKSSEQTVTSSEKKSKKKSKKDKEKKSSNAVAGGELSRDNLIKLFSEMVEDMGAILYRLSLQVQKMNEAGQPEAKVQKYFQDEYIKQIEFTHTKLLTKYKTTEQAADAAAKLHENDPEFIKIMTQLAKMQRAMQGEEPNAEEMAQLPAWLTLNKTIEIFSEVMNSVTDTIITTMETVAAKNEGKVLSEREREQQTTALYRQSINENKMAIFQKYGSKQIIFHFSVFYIFHCFIYMFIII